jgi:hypothetical protein
MFLQKVKVSHFAESGKGTNEFWANGYRKPGRHLKRIVNKHPEDIYTIVGVTRLQEGRTTFNGSDEPRSFELDQSHKVYIIAKSIGRRLKVLISDVTLVD